MARKRATLTDLLNDVTFRRIYEKYKLLATSAFEWEGLPDGIKSRHIETLLFEHGKAIFFRDPMMSYMCLKAEDSSHVNVYGDPLGYRAVGVKYSEYYSADDVVIIENNPLRLNTADFVALYVYKIAEAERTIDVNVKSVKRPYFITCDDKDVFTFKEIFRRVDGNEPAIFTDKRINPNSIAVFNTGVTFLGNELTEYIRSVEGALETFLGYNNNPVEKRERVNVSETNANNQLIESFAEMQDRSRQEACKAISEIFGVEVKVKRKGVEADAVEHVESDDRIAGDSRS